MANAAFIDAISRAQAALLADLAKLKEMVESRSGATLNQVRAELAATRLHLSCHFRLEEDDGWTNVVRRQEPRWEHAISQLVQEHRELLAALDTLVEQANADETLDDDLREKTLRWIERVLEHEAREDAVFEDAFIEDLGVGD
jgi:hypothetical protein